MKTKNASVLLASLFLVACQSLAPQPTATSTPTRTPTSTVPPTNTPTTEPTATHTPSPTPTVGPTLAPTKQPISSLAELEALGFEPSLFYPFHAFTSDNEPNYAFPTSWSLPAGLEPMFGGPLLNIPNPAPYLDVVGPGLKTYRFMIYTKEADCRLVFLSEPAGENELIYDFDVATESYFGSISGWVPNCMVNGWSDYNHNGLPEMVVTLHWNTNYWNGELRIFELTDVDSVVELTQGLPGPVSHWDFFAHSTETLVVIDMAWAKHDCIYPGAPFSLWLYRWDGDRYVDVTADSATDVKHYTDQMEAFVRANFGEPFIPDLNLGAMVGLLLAYDKHGQRDLGWQKFLDLADLSHWPGTDDEPRQWLEFDVNHFQEEYDAGLPLTPAYFDDFCLP